MVTYSTFRKIGYCSHQINCLGSKYTKNICATGARRKRICGVFRAHERVWWLQLSFIPPLPREADNAPPNPLSRF